MKLSEHIGKAAWSVADKALLVIMGVTYMLPQKTIGAQGWGVFIIVNTFLTSIFLLTDGLALQAIVNFGIDESKRKQTLTIAAIIHIFFVMGIATLIFFLRFFLAESLNEPLYIRSFSYFPILCLGFLARNFFMRVSQISINTKNIFIIDFAWVATSTTLILIGWKTGKLVDVDDMILISIISPFVSSVIGFMLVYRELKFTIKFDKTYFYEIVKFGFSQFANSATTALQTQGDSLLLKIFYSSAIVGNYDIAKKLFRLLEALREAGSLTIYPAVARLYQGKRFPELRVVIEKMMAFSFIGFLPIVIFSFFGPIDYILNLIYKGNYRLAPDLFRILSLSGLFMPLAMNLYVLLGIGASKNLLKLNIFCVVSTILCGFLLVPKFAATGTAYTVLINYFLLGVISTFIVHKEIGFSISGTLNRWKDISRFLQSLRNKAK